MEFLVNKTTNKIELNHAWDITNGWHGYDKTEYKILELDEENLIQGAVLITSDPVEELWQEVYEKDDHFYTITFTIPEWELYDDKTGAKENPDSFNFDEGNVEKVEQKLNNIENTT